MLFSHNSVEFGKSCEDQSWNHLIDPKRMALLKELYDVWQKVLQQYCYNRDWMKNCGLILWNAVAICEMSKASWQMGNSVWKTFWRTIWRTNNSLWSNGWIISDFCTRPVYASSIWQEILPDIFFGYASIAGEIGKRDILVADIEELEKMDASEIYPRRINAKEVLISQKGDEIIFPVADGTAKLSGRDYEFRVPTSQAGTNRKQWRSQWRNSRRLGRVTNRWRWSPCRLMVDPRWLHLSSSQWTSSSSLCAERRNIPFPLKYIDVTRSTYTNLDVMQEKRVMIIGMSTRIEVRQILGKGFTKFTILKEKPSNGVFVVQTCGAAQRKEKQEWANEKSQLDNARRLRELLFHWSGRWRV